MGRRRSPQCPNTSVRCSLLGISRARRCRLVLIGYRVQPGRGADTGLSLHKARAKHSRGPFSRGASSATTPVRRPTPALPLNAVKWQWISLACLKRICVHTITHAQSLDFIPSRLPPPPTPHLSPHLHPHPPFFVCCSVVSSFLQ